jgi:alkylhydroperoxidase family enzyme
MNRDEDAGIAAREADILGHPPRVPVPGDDEIDVGARSVVLEVLAAIGRPPPERMSDHTAIMLRHPELYRAHTTLGLRLYQGALPVRLRELAVLRVAWHAQAPFEWGEHVDTARRLAGLSGEEIERVKQGAAAEGWGEADRAVLAAVEELLADAMIGEESWAALTAHLDYRQLIELPVLVGQYLGVAFLQNALRFPLLPGNRGFSAE